MKEIAFVVAVLASVVVGGPIEKSRGLSTQFSSLQSLAQDISSLLEEDNPLEENNAKFLLCLGIFRFWNDLMIVRGGKDLPVKFPKYEDFDVVEDHTLVTDACGAGAKAMNRDRDMFPDDLCEIVKNFILEKARRACPNQAFEDNIDNVFEYSAHQTCLTEYNPSAEYSVNRKVDYVFDGTMRDGAITDVTYLGKGARAVVLKAKMDATDVALKAVTVGKSALSDVYIRYSLVKIQNAGDHLARLKKECDNMKAVYAKTAVVVNCLDNKNVRTQREGNVAAANAAEPAYFIMEYIQGVPLETLISGLTAAKAKMVATHLLNFVKGASEAKVAHNDLHGENVLVTDTTTMAIRVIDLSESTNEATEAAARLIDYTDLTHERVRGGGFGDRDGLFHRILGGLAEATDKEKFQVVMTEMRRNTAPDVILALPFFE